MKRTFLSLTILVFGSVDASLLRFTANLPQIKYYPLVHLLPLNQLHPLLLQGQSIIYWTILPFSAWHMGEVLLPLNCLYQVIFALSNWIVSPCLTLAVLTLFKFFIKMLGVYVLNVPIFFKVFVLMTLKLYALLRHGLMIRFVIAICSLIIILFFGRTEILLIPN